MYVRALGLGDRSSHRDIIELAPSLRSCMLVHPPPPAPPLLTTLFDPPPPPPH